MGGGGQGLPPMDMEGKVETGDGENEEGGGEEEEDGDQEHKDFKEVQAKLQEELVKTLDDLGHTWGWGCDQGPKYQDFSRYALECCDIGLSSRGARC